MDAALGSASDAAMSPASLVFVDEISHRVLNEYTNAIMTLSMAAAQTSDAEARITLAAVADRLKAYAEVHRALRPPRGTGRTDLAQYLQRLCGALAGASLTDRGVHLTLVAADAPMSTERCWRVGLILSELVTNSVRHAFPERGGAVVVRVGAHDGMTFCRVNDNGRPGSAKAAAGRGQAIVQDLVRQLGGCVEWAFAAEGNNVFVSIPSDVDL